MAVANQLAQEILKRYGGSVVAMAVYGSTAKNEDGEHSDLEMWVATTEDLPVKEDMFIYSGVLVDLSRCPAKEALDEARRVTPFWPVEADGFRSYLVLYERGDFIDKLREATSNLKDEDFRAAIQKLMLSTYERVGKLKNAWQRDDVYGVLHMGRGIAYSAAMLIGLANRRCYSSFRGMYQLSKQMERKPKEYDRLVDVAGGFVTADKERVYRAALELWENMQEFARELGIRWVDEKLVI